jgi:hypothetical protein
MNSRVVRQSTEVKLAYTNTGGPADNKLAFDISPDVVERSHVRQTISPLNYRKDGARQRL